LLLLQEYCDVGTLDSVVSSWEGEEENDARMLERLLLLKDVASGLQVLHANNVVHGDLVRFAGWLELFACKACPCVFQFSRIAARCSQDKGAAVCKMYSPVL
jgi:serine/threonine protein kinase